MAQKINIDKALHKVENFLPFLKVTIEVKNGELVLNNAKIREIDDFLLMYEYIEFKKILQKYGYDVHKNKNIFKILIAWILFK